jgi:hypothetical protein
MNARNKALPKTDYKGRPTYCIEATCPCKPCWNPHDVGTIDSQGHKKVVMVCLTNHVSGCPDRDSRQPNHLVERGICKRCGWRRTPQRRKLPWVELVYGAYNRTVRSGYRKVRNAHKTGYCTREGQRLGLVDFGPQVEWEGVAIFYGCEYTVLGYTHGEDAPGMWMDRRRNNLVEVKNEL